MASDLRSLDANLNDDEDSKSIRTGLTEEHETARDILDSNGTLSRVKLGRILDAQRYERLKDVEGELSTGAKSLAASQRQVEAGAKVMWAGERDVALVCQLCGGRGRTAP